ncbi:MAG: aspartyl protease [Nostocales cyanobacterium LE14-WE4]|jgi:predicted aspartyl protease|uniref:aspartyl protease n=1 Tax=Nostocales TaxID=1161 RepID=UPI0007FFEB74|nr:MULTISPECIES: aspartyl protease [Nostocales]MBJ7298053.1 aspartyl protease [Dolichospermum sp.]MCE2695889.1 aspartyl protease [Anabaena sp. 49633_E8]MDJ0501370.1 aspartyl protease [Nostocales cyanobacterium LE14-WE4]QSV52537.1 MAG: aspartyl protease [Dolichospermum sp. UKL201]MCE2699921.1 aspartyl protease [Anabaena sp. 49633_E8]
MIEGYFGENGQLFFEIELVTNDGLNLAVDALFDSGFAGFMAINTQDLDGLEWLYSGEEMLRTAKGESKFQIYLGQVILDGKQYQIPVNVGKGINEVLLGSEWLKFLRLVVDFPESILTLG